MQLIVVLTLWITPNLALLQQSDSALRRRSRAGNLPPRWIKPLLTESWESQGHNTSESILSTNQRAHDKHNPIAKLYLPINTNLGCLLGVPPSMNRLVDQLYHRCSWATTKNECCEGIAFDQWNGDSAPGVNSHHRFKEKKVGIHDLKSQTSLALSKNRVPEKQLMAKGNFPSFSHSNSRVLGIIYFQTNPQQR